MSTEANGASGWLRQGTAEEIRVLLARRRMSAAELARRTGIKQSTISRRMTGETAFDLDDLEAIARVLEVEAIDLLPRPIGSSQGAGRSSARSALNDSSCPPAPSTDRFRVTTPRPNVRAHRHVATSGSPFGGGRRDAVRPVSAVPFNKRRPTPTGPGVRPIPA